jgi:hypothetical protein
MSRVRILADVLAIISWLESVGWRVAGSVRADNYLAGLGSGRDFDQPFSAPRDLTRTLA